MLVGSSVNRHMLRAVLPAVLVAMEATQALLPLPHPYAVRCNRALTRPSMEDKGDALQGDREAIQPGCRR